MKVISIIDLVDEIADNMVSNDAKVVYINELEEQFYEDIVLELVEDTLDIVAGQSEYSLLSPYNFEDIVQVEVEGGLYSKTNAIDKFENSFYKSTGGFKLIPEPTYSVTGALNVIYRKKPLKKEIANIQTDDLSIIEDYGNRWVAIYEYFLKWKICISLKEFTEANNWALLYEEEVSKFYEWYTNAQPQLQNINVQRSW